MNAIRLLRTVFPIFLTQAIGRTLTTVLLFSLSPTSSLAHYELSTCAQALFKRDRRLLKLALPQDHLHWDIRHLRSAWQKSEGGPLSSKEPGLTVSEYLQTLEGMRADLAGHLRELQTRSSHPVLLSALEAFATEIDAYDVTAKGALSPDAMQSLGFWQLDRTYPSLNPDKLFTASFHALRSLAVGLLAELEVASLTPRPSHIGTYTFNLLSPKEKAKVRSKRQRDSARFLDFEIDLVFNGGATWAEVKARKSLNEAQQEELLERAYRLSWLLHFLNQSGRNIELQYYFVGSHPGNELLQELNNYGITTFYLGN